MDDWWVGLLRWTAVAGFFFSYLSFVYWCCLSICKRVLLIVLLCRYGFSSYEELEEFVAPF